MNSISLSSTKIEFPTRVYYVAGDLIEGGHTRYDSPEGRPSKI
jgi:hypothetical protein